jgi:hypothetical protein
MDSALKQIILAFICMITSIILGILIYYEELIADREYVHGELESSVQLARDASNATVTASTSGTSTSSSTDASGVQGVTSAPMVNLKTLDNIPTWMNNTVTDISKGRLFRITNPVFSYKDASNNGNDYCSKAVEGAVVADYSHLKYAFSKDDIGRRRDPSSNWCEFYWARGGKSGDDGLAFSIASADYVGANSSKCGADSSGVRVMNLYKWDNNAKTGIICYTDKPTVTRNADGVGSYLTVPETFTGTMTNDVDEHNGDGTETFCSAKESFVNYDSMKLFVNSASQTLDGYARFTQ